MSLAGSLLLATAFAAGVTGAWSPCGFSMVETLGSARRHTGARVVYAGCATFALGALAGGALTFGALGLLGAALGGAGSTAALVAAVAIALAAAAGEALGVRVVPQIRRQVPEPWRRTMPLPLAAGLYGVLLGLGFTTFVLTLAVWALAGIAVAAGSLQAGLLIGLGFGAGRALPVVAMAPRYATLGARLELAMAERPALLRGLRLADGALLAALAVAFLLAGSAQAAQTPRAQTVARQALDPSLAPGALAWRHLDGRAVVAAGEVRGRLRAQLVAIGGPYLATYADGRILVRDRAAGTPIAETAVAGVTQLAVSDGWVAWRARRGTGGGERLHVAPIADLAASRVLAQVGARAQIGRPALEGNRLAYAIATPHGSRIVVRSLAAADTGAAPFVLRARLDQLAQPALHAGRLLFVHATHCSQRLRLLPLGRPLARARTLLRIGATAWRDAGHEPGRTTQGREPGRCPRGAPPRTDAVLWTTALGGDRAYVTLLRPAAGRTAARARLVRVRR